MTRAALAWLTVVVLAASVVTLPLLQPATAHADVSWYGSWCEAWSGGVHIHGDARERPYAQGTALQECHGSIANHGIKVELQYWLPYVGRWVRLGYGRKVTSYGPTDALGALLAHTDRRYCINTRETRYRTRIHHWAENGSGQHKASTFNGRSYWRNCGQPGV